MQQNATPNGNKLTNSKPSDTAKHSPKQNSSSSVAGKADTTKKSTQPVTKKDTVEPPSPFTRKMNSFISGLDKAAMHGNINVGYDYGVLPFASNMQVPSGYYHSDGQGQFKIGMLPINTSYYFSDLNTISGLNNYFRFSFDAQRFRQQYMDKSMSDETVLKNQLANTYKEKQLAEQKLLYLKSMDGQPKSSGSHGRNGVADDGRDRRCAHLVAVQRRELCARRGLGYGRHSDKTQCDRCAEEEGAPPGGTVRRNGWSGWQRYCSS